MSKQIEGWTFGQFKDGPHYARREGSGTPSHKCYFDADGDLVCDASWVPGAVIRELLRLQAEQAKPTPAESAQTPPSDEPYLTVAEAARVCPRSGVYIQLLCREGRIPCIKIPRGGSYSYKLRISDLDAYLLRRAGLGAGRAPAVTE